jgi:hypothetical protein
MASRRTVVQCYRASRLRRGVIRPSIDNRVLRLHMRTLWGTSCALVNDLYIAESAVSHIPHAQRRDLT